MCVCVCVSGKRVCCFYISYIFHFFSFSFFIPSCHSFSTIEHLPCLFPLCYSYDLNSFITATLVLVGCFKVFIFFFIFLMLLLLLLLLLLVFNKYIQVCRFSKILFKKSNDSAFLTLTTTCTSMFDIETKTNSFSHIRIYAYRENFICKWTQKTFATLGFNAYI